MTVYPCAFSSLTASTVSCRQTQSTENSAPRADL